MLSSQITKLYEESCREKDSMVVKFAQAETKNIEAKCAADKLECRVRDLLKEKEFISNKMRAAMAEKQKAVTALEVKVEFKVQMICVVLALQNC